MHRRITLSTPATGLLLGAALLGAVAQPAAARPVASRVAATEVVVRAKTGDRDWLSRRLIAASADEARYYDAALPPATLRVVIDKLSTKRAGKAIAASLPIVAMFAGPNENRLKGRIEIVDAATGRVLRKEKIDCSDQTQFSAADGMLAYADLGLSFLPFGGLLSIAGEVGRSAANARLPAQEKLVRGFVMLSYKKLYGARAYRSFAARRKADQAAAKAAEAAPPAPPATAVTPTA